MSKELSIPSNMTPDSSTARLLAMLFSEFATNLEVAKNPLYTIYEQLRAEAVPIVDLVRGNVNEQGIIYPPEILQEILASAAKASRIYRPDSLGQRPARETISQYYQGLN